MFVCSVSFGPAARQHAFGRQQRLKQRCRAHQRDAFVREYLGHRADQRIRIAQRQCEQHLRQPPVRLDAAENPLVLDLPGHDGLRHAFCFERFDQLRQLAQRKPMDRRSAALLDLGRGLFLDGGDNHLHALRTRGVQHQEGKLAVARDQADTL